MQVIYIVPTICVDVNRSALIPAAKRIPLACHVSLYGTQLAKGPPARHEPSKRVRRRAKTGRWLTDPSPQKLLSIATL